MSLHVTDDAQVEEELSKRMEIDGGKNGGSLSKLIKVAPSDKDYHELAAAYDVCDPISTPTLHSLLA